VTAMKKRILSVLTLLAAFLGVAAPAASAATVPSAASVAVSRLLAEYNTSGASNGLFTTSGDPDVGTCKNTSHGGNCWWWAADTFMALITYAEQNTGSDVTSIENDLANTYSIICGQGSCPSSANQTGTDPFQNTWYDDTGWWEQAWINAYKLTKNQDYLYLAEQLWIYITNNGWDTTTCGAGAGNAGVDQHSGSGPDAYANALYLRNSAWLYSITGDSQFMTGNSNGGGALADASFVLNHLIDGPFNGIAPGTSGSQFMIADHPNSGCTGVGGFQMWLTSQGEMANAFSDMYAADKAYGGSDPGYYNQLADELSLSTIGNTGPYAGLAEPTVDSSGILSEPCEPQNGEGGWPDNCALQTTNSTTGATSDAAFLIFKGNFERGIYCSNHNFNDSALTAFISTNATSIAGLNHFGFLWDVQTNTLVNFATQASVLDGLNAEIGLENTGISSRFAMC
jgi:hypothetical protein